MVNCSKIEVNDTWGNHLHPALAVVSFRKFKQSINYLSFLPSFHFLKSTHPPIHPSSTIPHPSIYIHLSFTPHLFNPSTIHQFTHPSIWLPSIQPTNHPTNKPSIRSPSITHSSYSPASIHPHPPIIIYSIHFVFQIPFTQPPSTHQLSIH